MYASDQTVALISTGGAVIVGGFGLLAKLIGRTVKKQSTAIQELNTREHLLNKEVLERIEKKVDGVGSSISDHLSWHLHSPATTVIHNNPPATNEVAA